MRESTGEHWSSPNGCHADCPECAYETELFAVIELMKQDHAGTVGYNVINDNRVELQNPKGKCIAVITSDELTEYWNKAEMNEAYAGTIEERATRLIRDYNRDLQLTDTEYKILHDCADLYQTTPNEATDHTWFRFALIAHFMRNGL